MLTLSEKWRSDVRPYRLEQNPEDEPPTISMTKIANQFSFSWPTSLKALSGQQSTIGKSPDRQNTCKKNKTFSGKITPFVTFFVQNSSLESMDG
jgi:hypothetical protein